IALGHYEPAIGVYEAALAIDPQDADGHAGYGEALAGVGRTEEAIAELGRAAELKPKEAAFRRRLGELCREAGRHAEAAAALAEAVKSAPSAGLAHRAYGLALEDAGEHERALEALSQAVLLGVQDAELSIGLGAGLYHLDRFGEARDWLNAARHQAPDDPNARYYLGLTLLA